MYCKQCGKRYNKNSPEKYIQSIPVQFECFSDYIEYDIQYHIWILIYQCILAQHNQAWSLQCLHYSGSPAKWCKVSISMSLNFYDFHVLHKRKHSPILFHENFVWCVLTTCTWYYGCHPAPNIVHRSSDPQLSNKQRSQMRNLLWKVTYSTIFNNAHVHCIMIGWVSCFLLTNQS